VNGLSLRNLIAIDLIELEMMVYLLFALLLLLN
jgi:hypothetical protein